MIKAFIYDLDNTLYPVPVYAEKMFGSLFQLIEENGAFHGSMHDIRYDLMRKPFQVVAAKYKFTDALIQKGTCLLKALTYKDGIKPFTDYPEIKNVPGERYLVTSGFFKLQWSKIRRMEIEGDFKEIHIVDLSVSPDTKKDVFASIIERNNYKPSEVLVIGDDPDSELRAASELGIESVLYDKDRLLPDAAATYRIADFSELSTVLAGRFT
jgi:putative hydrolase of the HAD superfamily